LSAQADAIRPITVEERHGLDQSRRRFVSRTVNRIHTRLEDGREWLFVRNPLDARRAMGYLVNHADRKISTYDESDLRNAAGIRGWADILSSGFDPSKLHGLSATAETREIGNVPFVRYVGDAGEVWWNADLLLAAEVRYGNPVGSAANWIVEDIRDGVDESLLALPMARFPDYREASYVDWLEVKGH
jgi:hypothetical protein